MTVQFNLSGAQLIKGLRTARIMSDTQAPGQVFSSVWIAAKVNPEDVERGAVAFSATDRYIYGTVIRTEAVAGASGSAGMALPVTLVGTLLKMLAAKHTYEVTLSPPIADGEAPEFGIKDMTEPLTLTYLLNDTRKYPKLGYLLDDRALVPHEAGPIGFTVTILDKLNKAVAAVGSKAFTMDPPMNSRVRFVAADSGYSAGWSLVGAFMPPRLGEDTLDALKKLDSLVQRELMPGEYA